MWLALLGLLLGFLVGCAISWLIWLFVLWVCCLVLVIIWLCRWFGFLCCCCLGWV